MFGHSIKRDQIAALGFVLGVLGFSSLFNLHVTKLFGVKDLATFLAFDKLCVFMPGDDSDPGVFAGGCHLSWETFGIEALSARL